MKGRTLSVIALGLIVGLGASCDISNKSTNQVQTREHESQRQTKDISGKIVSIDEDSFALAETGKAANFEFEHFRIEAPDGKTYKLIFPGPSNYQIGDEVNFRYKVQTRVRHNDLIQWAFQKGYFDVDGIIIR